MKKNYMCYLFTSDTKYFFSGNFRFLYEVIHLELRIQFDVDVAIKKQNGLVNPLSHFVNNYLSSEPIKLLRRRPDKLT